MALWLIFLDLASKSRELRSKYIASWAQRRSSKFSSKYSLNLAVVNNNHEIVFVTELFDSDQIRSFQKRVGWTLAKQRQNSFSALQSLLQVVKRVVVSKSVEMNTGSPLFENVQCVNVRESKTHGFEVLGFHGVQQQVVSSEDGSHTRGTQVNVIVAQLSRMGSRDSMSKDRLCFFGET
ncbi:hypothetical protein OGAPHI_007209 [Ogataea philodendri]|uniref:Uncharacterized protein n=1 Tax=Ogataea philodendri TaxID=1378263 RepID=A0A9P8SZE0_9ASCO|nr:uncharacterized protein OGAPHI_007209 [Ogataea philodendri]KAH3660004.1 hypothetical protein OGAPHI_007209 [Ogataea philodendri]